MTDDLTNDQISLLCDIGELHQPRLTEDQKPDLKRLLAGGYIELAESPPGQFFKLTAKARKFLGERGAGLNEA
jgi:hypothetical protein